MSLNIDDVRLMETIIRVCQQRGAILAPEMIDVGNLYRKLVEVLDKVNKNNASGQQGMTSMNQTIPPQGLQQGLPMVQQQGLTQQPQTYMPVVTNTGNTYNLSKFNIPQAMPEFEEKKNN